MFLCPCLFPWPAYFHRHEIDLEVPLGPTSSPGGSHLQVAASPGVNTPLLYTHFSLATQGEARRVRREDLACQWKHRKSRGRQRYREKIKSKDAETQADREKEMEAHRHHRQGRDAQTEAWKGTRRVKSPGIRPEVDGQSKHSRRGTREVNDEAVLSACPEESLRNGGARSMAQGAGGGQRSPIVRRPFPHSAWLCTPAWGWGWDRLGDTRSLAGRLACSVLRVTEALEHPQRRLKGRDG